MFRLTLPVTTQVQLSERPENALPGQREYLRSLRWKRHYSTDRLLAHLLSELVRLPIDDEAVNVAVATKVRRWNGRTTNGTFSFKLFDDAARDFQTIKVERGWPVLHLIRLKIDTLMRVDFATLLDLYPDLASQQTGTADPGRRRVIERGRGAVAALADRFALDVKQSALDREVVAAEHLFDPTEKAFIDFERETAKPTARSAKQSDRWWPPYEIRRLGKRGAPWAECLARTTTAQKRALLAEIGDWKAIPILDLEQLLRDRWIAPQTMHGGPERALAALKHDLAKLKEPSQPVHAPTGQVIDLKAGYAGRLGVDSQTGRPTLDGKPYVPPNTAAELEIHRQTEDAARAKALAEGTEYVPADLPKPPEPPKLLAYTELCHLEQVRIAFELQNKLSSYERICREDPHGEGMAERRRMDDFFANGGYRNPHEPDDLHRYLKSVLLEAEEASIHRPEADLFSAFVGEIGPTRGLTIHQTMRCARLLDQLTPDTEVKRWGMFWRVSPNVWWQTQMLEHDGKRWRAPTVEQNPPMFPPLPRNPPHDVMDDESPEDTAAVHARFGRAATPEPKRAIDRGAPEADYMNSLRRESNRLRAESDAKEAEKAGRRADRERKRAELDQPKPAPAPQPSAVATPASAPIPIATKLASLEQLRLRLAKAKEVDEPKPFESYQPPVFTTEGVVVDPTLPPYEPRVRDPAVRMLLTGMSIDEYHAWRNTHDDGTLGIWGIEIAQGDVMEYARRGIGPDGSTPIGGLTETLPSLTETLETLTPLATVHQLRLAEPPEDDGKLRLLSTVPEVELNRIADAIGKTHDPGSAPDEVILGHLREHEIEEDCDAFRDIFKINRRYQASRLTAEEWIDLTGPIHLDEVDDPTLVEQLEQGCDIEVDQPIHAIRTRLVQLRGAL